MIFEWNTIVVPVSLSIESSKNKEKCKVIGIEVWNKGLFLLLFMCKLNVIFSRHLQQMGLLFRQNKGMKADFDTPFHGDSRGILV